MLRLERLEERLGCYNLFGTTLDPGPDGYVEYSYEEEGEIRPRDVAAVEEGLNMWASRGNVSFREVERGTPGTRIRIYFDETTSPFLAVAQYPPDAKILFGAPPTPPIAGHEIGHTLGIDHSNDPDALMNGTLLRATEPNVDDTLALHALYGAGIGEVIPLTSRPPYNPNDPDDLLDGRTDPYPGYAGEVLSRSADYDNNPDTPIDLIFLPESNSQGHLKAFSSSGQLIGSLLAFPGYAGECTLEAEGNRVVAAALVSPTVTHLKGYVGGEEVNSILVNLDNPTSEGATNA
jgi:hypothetical protein